MRKLLITNDESGGTVLNGRPARKIKLKKIMLVMLLFLAGMFQTDALAQQVAALITDSGTTNYSTVTEAVTAANASTVDCEVKILTSCTSTPFTIENANGKVITLNTGNAGTVLTITASGGWGDLICANTSLDLKGNGGMVIADINEKSYVNAVHAGSNQVTVRMYDGFVLKTINGGTEARMLAIYNGSKCYIYGGRLICPKGAEVGVNHNLSTIVNANSYVYIYGGEFHWDVKGDHSWYPYWAGVLDSADAIEFIIYGGYFDGPLWWAGSSTAQKYIFYGGKYTTNKLKNNYYQKEGSIDWTNYIGEGRTANNITESYNGTTYYYGVTYNQDPVAVNVNTSVNYYSVQDAVTQAQVGDTIKMLKDSEENVTIPNGKDITLKLNGKVLTANNTSGTVITNNGTLTLTDSGGGNITGGAKGVMQNGTMTVGGKLNITGNTANLYLPEDKTVAVSSDTPLNNGANIGVTTATAPTSTTPVAVTGTNTDDYSMYFMSDNTKYAVINEDNVVKLKVSVECNTTTAYNPTNIINGDFEVQPVCTPTNRNAPDGGWNTTEITDWCGMYFEWISKTWGDRGYNTALLGAKDNAVVEMNCQNAAVLYQDLTTRGRDVIRWTLNHGVVTRSGESQQDIRVMVGAPQRDGSGNIIQATGVGINVDAKINNTTLATYESTGVTNGGDVYGYANVSELAALSLSRSTQASSWYTAKGVYVVPEGQTVTRFAFISLDATTPANGNLLDAITFSTLVGNLQAYTDANGDVIIIGYWGDTDASKKLCVKTGETVYQYDMSGVKTTCGGDFKITFSKSQIGTATEVEIYHQDYESAKVTVKIAIPVTLHFCTTEPVTGAEDFYGYIPGETTPLPVVSRNGYTFAGWYTNAEYTGEPVTEIGPEETSKTLEFYAKWDADITSDYWAAVVRAYDKGDRPLTGSYTYYPGGTGSATTVPYEGVLYTDPDGNKYYCYKTVEMAIEAAQAGALNTNYCSATNPNGVFTEGTPYNYELNDGVNPNIINYTDVVTLNKDYDQIIYNMGLYYSSSAPYGIRKGIVLDLNGKTAKGIAMGKVADNQVLVVRNGSLGTNYETDVFDDEGGTGYLSGKVVFHNVNLTGTIWASTHAFYMLNGNYDIRLGNPLNPTEDPDLLQLRGGYYKNDPRAYNIDYSDCHVELASTDPTIEPYFCRVVKGASQYTIHFVAGCNNVTIGGNAFTSKDVLMTYGGSLTEVPVLDKANTVLLGWSDSPMQPTVKYTTEQLNTLTSTHGADVYIYPVFGMQLGVPVNVALADGSDVPEAGREYTFNLKAETNDAPMPTTTTLKLASPTAAGEANKVGYSETAENHPWKVNMPQGVFKYSVTQTIDTEEAETLDEGKWYIEITTYPYADDANYQITLSEYNGNVDPMTASSFHIVKAYESGDFMTAADVTVDEQGRTHMKLGGGILTQAINNADTWKKQLNTAVIKGKFEVDFDRNFKAVGSLTPPSASTPDGTLVGFIANPKVPTSDVVAYCAGDKLGMLMHSDFSNGIILEFDCYDNWKDGSGHNEEPKNPFYNHFTLETLDNAGNPTVVEHWNMTGIWPTGACTYVIENDVTNNVLKFTVTLPGNTSKVYSISNPKSYLGSNKAYLIMSGSIRRGPNNMYGVGAVGSVTPSLEMYFDSFYYIGRPDGYTGNGIFVNSLDHVWEYTAEGNVLSARCKHDSDPDTHCANPGFKNLVVTATDHNYDGQQSEAEITTDEWTTAGIEKPSIKYIGVTPTTYEETTDAPANFGKYKTTIKAGEATAASPFVIRPQIFCVSADEAHGIVTIKNGNGDLISSGSFVEPYENVTLTATAVEHWHFKNWATMSKYDNPDPVDVLPIQMNENIKHYTANFAIDKHTVTAMPNIPAFGSVSIEKVPTKDGGTVSAAYDYGSVVLLTATPAAEKYTFLYWTKVADTTAVISTSKTYQFNLTNDTTFKAIFVNEVQVNIEATPMDGGEVTIKNNDTGDYLTPEQAKHILYGTSVTIEATCSGDYAFAGWYIKGTNTLFSKKQSMTFDAKTLILNLEARFTDAVIWVRVKK